MPCTESAEPWAPGQPVRACAQAPHACARFAQLDTARTCPTAREMLS